MKFAPAREDGAKPYVVGLWRFGRHTEKIGWGKTSAAAKWDAFGRLGTGEHIIGARRATPSDLSGPKP